MKHLSCATARIWLQAPHELDPADTAELNAHLAGCRQCAEFASQQEKMDAVLVDNLQPLQIPSVARQVRAHLEAHPVQRPRHARVRLTWFFVPLALVTMFLASFFPQTLPDSNGLVPARAAWHLVRAHVGYPLAIDPSRPNHLLAGAFGQVYESRNGGETWSRLAPFPPHLVIRALAIDASAPNRYLVATKHSIFLSTNAGQRWMVVRNSLPGAMNMFLAQDPRVPATFYVGPSILWKSIDHGATWIPAGRGTVFAPDGIQSMQFSSNGTLLAGIWHGGVAVSTDGGRSWQRRAQGLAPDVMDVEPGQGKTLWAATDRGLYVSPDMGLHWRRSHLPGHFFATSLLNEGKVVLAGGDHALYRSADGGAHWAPATVGLPLDPYVFGIWGDPVHPQRVYASLNSDGIFRSDDGGQHWRAMDQGLPLKGSDQQPAHYLLFERRGALWISDTAGTDPGVLTVQRDVKLAALSPDQAAAAYVAGDAGRWGVYVVNAGGSSTRILLQGKGTLPSALHWSPNSSSLAIVERSHVTVTNLSHAVTWSLPGADALLGWTADGRSLLTWHEKSGQVLARAPQTGAIESSLHGLYPAVPLLAPDGRHLALAAGAALEAGTLDGQLRPVVTLHACRPIGWSDDSTRFLAACRHSVAEISASGTVLALPNLPGPVRWLPGTHDLLYFRNGNLWVWAPTGSHLLIAQAGPVLPAQ